VTLLCAKRLLDCERPLWLALTVAGPALFMILAFGTGIEHVWSVTTVLAAYSAVFALPALIACAVYDAED
jgi:uncharacterized membrane protein YhaH (DUF805 family)